MASKHPESSGWLELLIAGLTDWAGMAKLVEAFGDPGIAAMVVMCGLMTCFCLVVAIAVIWADQRESEGRRRERQQKRKLDHERNMAILSRQSKQKQRR